jgi:hypothetical protein
VSEGTRTGLLVKGQSGEEIVKRVVAAGEEAPPDGRIRAGLEVAIEEAETDPAAARSALHRLRGDPERLDQVEAWLGGDPEWATLALGAAIQIAYTELASPSPDPRSLLPEMRTWLEGAK